MFYELDYPPYIVRITETCGGKLQLIASGEEHDQGILADEYDDFYARYPIFQAEDHVWPYGSLIVASRYLRLSVIQEQRRMPSIAIVNLDEA